MRELRDAIGALHPMPPEVLAFVVTQLGRAKDVQIVERDTLDERFIHFKMDPETRVMTVHGHSSRHELMVRLLEAWRDNRRAPCDQCNGSLRILVGAEDPRASAYLTRPGFRVTAVKSPLIEIPCPCPCHEED